MTPEGMLRRLETWNVQIDLLLGSATRTRARSLPPDAPVRRLLLAREDVRASIDGWAASGSPDSREQVNRAWRRMRREWRRAAGAREGGPPAPPSIPA